MSEDHSITRSAGVVGSATLLSRFLGLARDILTARFFGTGLAFSAFVMAFTIPNLLRKLLGEGALNGAFIPVFTEYLEKEGKDEALRVANIVLSLLAVILATLVIGGVLVLSLIGWIWSPPEIYELARELLLVMLPYIFFICLTGLAMGILNSLRHFALPALAPVALNLAWIVSLVFLCPHFGDFPKERIFGLALGVVIGGMAQLGIQLPILRRKGFRFRFKLDWRHPAVRKILLLMGPSVLGLGIVQINIVVDRFLAGLIRDEAPAVLYYGNRLVQFPLGVFVFAFATAVLPVMASQVAREKLAEFKKTFSYTIRSVFLITVPAAVGLVVLRRPIVALIFQRGAFDIASTEATAWVLLCYCVGLVAFAGLKIVVQAFYSFQDTKTPVKVGVAAMLLNLGLNLLVVFVPFLRSHLREGGLALSTSIAAFVNLTVLAWFLRRRTGPLRGREIGTCTWKVCAASLVMGVAVWGSLGLLRGRGCGEGLAGRSVLVLLPLAVGVVVFLGSALLLRVRAVYELRAAFFRRKPAGE